MTLRRITGAQARLLKLAVDVDIPRRMEDWTDHLEAGQLTDEMRDVFEAFGYLERETKRQRKPKVGFVRAAGPVTEEELQSAIESAGLETGIDIASE